MPLPSQVARPSAAAGRSNMQRAKRPPAKPMLIGAGVIAVLAVGVYALTRGGGPGPRTAAGQPAEVKAPEPQPEKVLATNDKPADPAPVEIRQGRSSQTPAQAAPLLGHTSGADPKTEPKPEPKAPSVAAPAPAPSPAPPPAASLAVSAEAQGLVTAATQKLESGDPVGARVMFTRLLSDARLSESDRQSVRDELSSINDDLVFSSRVAKDDPTVGTYSVQSGDSLIKIAQKLGLGPDYRFIARVNKLPDLHSLHEGQKLKVVKGPFHAVVNKAAYRMDIYMGPPDKQDEWVYVRSFKVGLGESNGTPLGTFVVKKGSKLIDPPWINPHTGEKFAGGDPKNPIGHRWVGLEGQGDTAKFTGYGIHGTIDPDSIGQQRSMGCVRMASGDIEVVWELLGVGVSVVKIVP